MRGPASERFERTLLLCTRGVKARHRHLLRDLLQLLPHGKLGSKLPTDEGLSGVLEVRETRGGFAVELKQYEWRGGMSALIWRSPYAFRRRRDGSDGAPTCDLHHALMQAERHLWEVEVSEH